MYVADIVLSCPKDLSAHPKVCSSTDLRNLPECLWRCPSTDPSPAFVAPLGLSMALGGSHIILGRATSQTRVPVVSDLPSSVVLLD